MTTPAGRVRRTAGFTLLELIVAVSILALIAVFSWRGLDSLIREREALAASQASIDAVQRLFARVERDALAAGDVALDGGGTMVLLAGSASLDGGSATTVRYRFGDGTLQRTVAGAEDRPLTVLGDVTALTMEAWSPVVGGGSWVRTRQPPPDVAAAPAVGTAVAAQSAQAAPTAPVGQAPQTAQTATASPTAVAGTVPSGVAASAIRMVFTRAGGPPVTRTFLVGGG